ncbi:hypothetical protein FB566_2045 [Stackebrandtia endophytica]|uniref:Uncharacterized protein n=1 Tax=Stackebrandtia endophytica TaxID=1496996 RepID=A0A543AVA1_9ACTN|nr:hypothetical protein [Stackebrandtia endophytica]TQL76513.1 hypothetical protein FB566_2045 [Stackebrandtia endophytica]
MKLKKNFSFAFWFRMELKLFFGFIPDATVWNTTRHVFEIRGTHDVPGQIPDPPPGWKKTYVELAEGLTETEAQLAAALKLLREFWDQVLYAVENEPHQED